MIVILRDGRGREGVGLGNVGTGRIILIVQVGDDIRPRQAQDIVIPLHLALVPREALAEEIGFIQAAALDHHAPRAIEDQDALFRGLFQSFNTLRPVHVLSFFYPSPKPLPLKGARGRHEELNLPPLPT